ncbi:MAG: DNA phosphorothioation-dependent restriction protein DptG [Paraglaciecola sp.]|jgi:DNA phosphorothioation-dependent restriction protein DptG
MIRSQLVPPSSNALSTYLPLRTKDKHYKFQWDIILGYFAHALYDKPLVTSDIEEFKTLCKARFSSKLDEPAFWTVLEKMYFENEQLFEISPELLIFKASKDEIDTNSKKLGDMFISLLNGFMVESPTENQLNLFEKEIKSEFDCFLINNKPKKKIEKKTEKPYLPFLTEYFKVDLQFLSSRPQYFLKNFHAVIRLYGFLYISQMALNIKNWANGEPKSKPCFFIVDNEKASDERTLVKNYGYTQLHSYLEYLFPFLVMNETLQEKGEVKPLWQLFEGLSDGNINDLNEFGDKYTQDRNERESFKTNQVWRKTQDKKELLSQLLEMTYTQFEKKQGNLTTYNETVVRGIKNSMCDPFIQRRGRAGQVLTFNQDYIVLLTNLAIGEQEKLRLHELIKEFEARGVFFDKQSQQSLIEFYERMGNVERMSDSGDAVYVRKTV